MASKKQLNEAQLKLLQSVFDYFNESGEWPDSYVLNVQLREMGDLWDIAESIGFNYIRAEQYKESNPTSLTVLGVSQSKGSESLLSLFVKVVKYCSKKYIDNPHDSKITGIELSNALNIQHDELNKLMKILIAESRFASGHNSAKDPYTFELKLSKEILKYDPISNIDDYIKLAYPWLEADTFKPISHDEVFYFDNMTFNLRILEYIPDLVSDDKLKNAIVQDANELMNAMQTGSWKCTCILCGSICEALLFDYLNPIIPDVIQDMRRSDKATLKNLIDKAVQQDLISKYIRGMLDAVREMRNIIHPALLDDIGIVSPKMAEASFKLLEAIAEAISLKRTKESQ